MAIVVLFEFPNDAVEKYDEALRTAPELVDQPARPYHVCYETNGGWGVVDVWESEEAFAKFGDVLGPLMQKIGLEAEPQIRRVHNIIT